MSHRVICPKFLRSAYHKWMSVMLLNRVIALTEKFNPTIRLILSRCNQSYVSFSLFIKRLSVK